MPVQSAAVLRVKRWIVAVIIGLMAVDFVLVVAEAQWLSAFLILSIGLLILITTVFSKRLIFQLPAELEILALGFVFAALFLGEVKSYYDRIWWWDMALHATSGLLMGVLGFLLVYILNESKRIQLAMTPHFIAFFAFLFAVAVGALWEIFEFSMDRIFGTHMQKAMFDDPSGLTDTMWDMIVNTVGALIVSVLGWWYMHQQRQSIIDVWIEKVIQRNPRWFSS